MPRPVHEQLTIAVAAGRLVHLKFEVKLDAWMEEKGYLDFPRPPDQQMEAIASVQDRLAASSAWVGASAAWIGEDVTAFHPISPSWVQRQLADHVAVTVPANVAIPARRARSAA